MSANTSKKRGTPRRHVSGLLLLDKPVGLTSNQALQKVKELFRARKAGHTGSLDPLASGMLPLCFGEATKVSAFLLDADKVYRVHAVLGARTDTADADGEVIEHRDVPGLEAHRVESVLDRFTGEIEQIPPMYSALKHQGQRLYRLARQGVEVERTPRRVTIHAIRLLSQGPSELELEVRCSKGTYVRTLVEDIAAALGTVGHVGALRRLRVGSLTEQDMVRLETLEVAADDNHALLDRWLLPVDRALENWPKVLVPGPAAGRLRQGQVIRMAGLAPGWFRLYERGGGFLGLGEVGADGSIQPRRMFRDDGARSDGLFISA